MVLEVTAELALSRLAGQAPAVPAVAEGIGEPATGERFTELAPHDVLDGLSQAGGLVFRRFVARVAAAGGERIDEAAADLDDDAGEVGECDDDLGAVGVVWDEACYGQRVYAGAEVVCVAVQSLDAVFALELDDDPARRVVERLEPLRVRHPSVGLERWLVPAHAGQCRSYDSRVPRTDSASRVVAAPVGRVFAALVDRDALLRWLPPTGMTGRFERFDARAGGSYRLVLTLDDPASTHGKATANSDVVEARFVEITEGERVVQAVDFESDKPEFVGTMTMTWEVAPVDGGTLVRITATDVPDGISAEDHAAGLASSLENLASYLAST